MRCDEAQELITGLVDDEITASERAAVEEHLGECPDCRGQFERETALKRELRLAASAVVVPDALRETIRTREGKLGSDTHALKTVSALNWFAAPRARSIYAFAAAVVVIIALLFQLQGNEDIATPALAIHENVVSGERALVRVNDAAQLRKQLSLAVNHRFAPIALDLSVIKLHPVAGFFEKIGDREVLVTVYEGAGATITCFTFVGGEGDAPRNSERFFDPDRKINFYAFSRGAVNGVMHQEGQLICVLVSKMTPADLLGVARGKQHHA